MDNQELARAVITAQGRIAETINSSAYIARCMHDAASDLRTRARKLEAKPQRCSPGRAELIDQRARALHRAADEIDKAAEAYVAE